MAKKKGVNLDTPRPRIQIRALVRDKDGHPKFDDPSLIPDYLHRLSEEDIAYLENQYGEGICTSKLGS